MESCGERRAGSEEEHQAITALQRGEIEALETLVRTHQTRAVRAAYAITGDRTAAEDAVTDAFVSVWAHIKQFDPRRPFGPWFYRIVINCALKELRRARSRPSEHSPPMALDQQADPALGPEDNATLREMKQMLLASIQTLPARQRAAIVMRYWLDMDEATIATALHAPIGTVKWRLHSARNRLRRQLMQDFGLGG